MSRRRGDGAVALAPSAGPNLAQLLAEELIADLVRRHIDVVGLLELEREVLESVSGIADGLGATPGAVPAPALAAALVDQAVHAVLGDWQAQRQTVASDDCVCCAMEAVELQRRARARDRASGGERGGAGRGEDVS